MERLRDVWVIKHCALVDNVDIGICAGMLVCRDMSLQIKYEAKMILILHKLVLAMHNNWHFLRHVAPTDHRIVVSSIVYPICPSPFPFS